MVPSLLHFAGVQDCGEQVGPQTGEDLDVLALMLKCVPADAPTDGLGTFALPECRGSSLSVQRGRWCVHFLHWSVFMIRGMKMQDDAKSEIFVMWSIA